MMNHSGKKRGWRAASPMLLLTFSYVNRLAPSDAKRRPIHRTLPRRRSRRCLSAHVHLYLLRLGLFALRDGQRQHAVFIVGLDGFGVDRICQCKAASERAVAALYAQVVLLVGDFLELALSANGQNIVLDADVQLLRPNVRQVGFNDELMPAFRNVDRRYPGSQILLLRCAPEKIAEQAIQLSVKRAAWLPTIQSSHYMAPPISLQQSNHKILARDC